MFEIGLCSLAIFVVVAFIVGIMDTSIVSKELVYVTAGIGYGGLAIGFLIAALKWLFVMI